MKFAELLEKYSHLAEAPRVSPPATAPEAMPPGPPPTDAPQVPNQAMAPIPGEAVPPPDLGAPPPGQDITQPGPAGDADPTKAPPMVPEGEFDLIKQIANALTVNLKGDDLTKVDEILSLINDPDSPITAGNARPVLKDLQDVMSKYVKSSVDAALKVNPAVKGEFPGEEIE